MTLNRDEALEMLARELHWKMETLDPPCGGNSDVDPTPEGLWQEASDWQRGFCRKSIEWLFAHEGLIRAALVKI